jgi:hypothetical protein
MVITRVPYIQARKNFVYGQEKDLLTVDYLNNFQRPGLVPGLARDAYAQLV